MLPYKTAVQAQQILSIRAVGMKNSSREKTHASSKDSKDRENPLCRKNTILQASIVQKQTKYLRARKKRLETVCCIQRVETITFHDSRQLDMDVMLHCHFAIKTIHACSTPTPKTWQFFVDIFPTMASLGKHFKSLESMIYSKVIV